MKTYQYIDETNNVVHVIDEDGISRMSMVVSALPDGVVIKAHTPPPLPVPTTVSRFKARAAMAQAGYFTQVDDFMATLPKTDIRRMAWEDATEFDRTSTTLKSMAEMLGLTETDLDNLFILATGIEA